MFAYHIIYYYYFLKFLSRRQFHISMTPPSEILNKLLHHPHAYMHLLFTQSVPILLWDSCVINNRVHIAFFNSNVVCSVYTLQFTQFVHFFFFWENSLYLFCCVIHNRSIAFFDSNIACNYHAGWCDITSTSTFVIML